MSKYFFDWCLKEDNSMQFTCFSAECLCAQQLLQRYASHCIYQKQSSLVWSSTKQKICKILNIWFQSQNTRKQLNSSCYVPQPSSFFPCCLCPLSQRRVFPPAASARTSGITQLRQSFQAKSSQNAETKLEATAAPALSLGALSSRKTLCH